MREPSLELLFDLSRLLRRYPPEAWNEIFVALRNPRVLRQLTSFTRRMGELSKEVRSGSDFRMRDPDLHKVEDDFEKGYLLSRLRLDLMRKPIAQIRDVAHSLRIEVEPSTKKSELVSHIMLILAELSPTDLKKESAEPFNEQFSQCRRI